MRWRSRGIQRTVASGATTLGILATLVAGYGRGVVACPPSLETNTGKACPGSAEELIKGEKPFDALVGCGSEVNT